MATAAFELASFVEMPRLAALATSARPAWLWSADGSRIIWANAVGAAAIGKPRSSTGDAPAAEIVRLAASLPPGDRERLERLRGFGAGIGVGRALTCLCSRVALPDGEAAILVAAAEPAGPALPLRQRIDGLLAEEAGALAAFAPDRSLLHANAAAQQILGGATQLSALGLERLVAKALESGRAGDTVRLPHGPGEATAVRLGAGENRVVVVKLPQAPSDPASAAATMARDAGRQGPPAAPIGPAAAETTEPAVGEPNSAPNILTPAAAEDSAQDERRQPLRFVWHMDPDGRFDIGSEDFIELAGPRTMAACGRSWNDVAAEMKLDPENRVAQAIATRETWSGIPVFWPIDESGERLPVELSGLPVFDRDRVFQGYRGFGVCRDVARINRLVRARQTRSVGLPAAEPGARDPDQACTDENAPMPQVPAPRGLGEPVGGDPAVAVSAEPAMPGEEHFARSAAAANVVPFRGGPAGESKVPSLSAVERNAFRELAQELTARLRGDQTPLSEEARQLLQAAAPHPAAMLPLMAMAQGPAAASLAEAIALDPAARVVPAAEPALPPQATMAADRDRDMARALHAANKEIGDLKSRLERTARREAQKAAAAKADFLAKISHEIRTPLSSIIGFAEVILAERFGTIGNDRYREYLKDIHGAGSNLVSLLNDLIDLTRIETGQLELKIEDIDLNELTQQCVGLMQPQANRGRVIIRTALASALRPVRADARSLRQIALSLLGHAIKRTNPGGQVIVSTAAADGGEAILRVRDGGAGIRENEIDAMLDPFRDATASAAWHSGGGGLALPLAKALAEANRASFAIKSAPNTGTLVEIGIPAGRASGP